MASLKTKRKQRNCEKYRLRVGRPAGPGQKGSKRPHKPGSNPQPPLTDQIILAVKRGYTDRAKSLRAL